jgi:hypothetical protein
LNSTGAVPRVIADSHQARALQRLLVAHAISQPQRCTHPVRAGNPLPTSVMLQSRMVNITGIVDEVARLEALRALDMLDTPCVRGQRMRR